LPRTSADDQAEAMVYFPQADAPWRGLAAGRAKAKWSGITRTELDEANIFAKL